MNEIPFSQNIMSVCVRTASRLVESLAPVNEKTWTVLKRKMETELRNNIFYVDFCLSQIAATCCHVPVMLFHASKIQCIDFSFFTVCMKL